MALALSIVCVALSLALTPSRVVDPAELGFSPDVAPDVNTNALQKALDGGRLPLSTATQFELPCATIRDFNTFTVEAKLKFNEMEDGTQLGLFSQITADVGWSFSVMNKSGTGNPMTLNVNGVDFNVGWFRCRPGETHTFTIAAKRGMVVAYMDGKVLKRCFATVTPPSTPLKVGWRGCGPLKEMKGVELLDMKILGPETEFFADGEPREFAIGYKGGKGWMVAVPPAETNELPRLLFYGDSISDGYSPALHRLLDGKAYLYHWRHFVPSLAINEAAFNDVATLAKYDMIVFNNGLHSIDRWTPDKASDGQIADVTRAIVRAFRKGAPHAALVWLSTTPHTARRGPDGKVSALGELDYMVRRINRIAAEVMREEGVGVIDGYGMLVERLDLAIGDQYHWKGEAYEILAAAIAKEMLKR